VTRFSFFNQSVLGRNRGPLRLHANLFPHRAGKPLGKCKGSILNAFPQDNAVICGSQQA